MRSKPASTVKANVRVINNLAPGLDYSQVPADFGDPLDAVKPLPATSGMIPRRRTDLNAAFQRRKACRPGRLGTTAEKIYFPTEPGVAVAAWRVLIWQPVDAYYVIVDAKNGTMLWRKNIVDHQTQSATYQIYGNSNAYIDVADNPAPLSPFVGLTPAASQGALISRTNRTLVGNEGTLSFNNNGWINDGANIPTVRDRGRC